MLQYLLFGCGALLILYYGVSTVAVGPVAFSGWLALFGVFLVGLGFLDRRFGQLPWVLRCKRVTLPLAAVGLVCFVVLEAVVYSGAARKDTEPADYIIVLGAGLRGDQMSLTLLRRMEAALACVQGETIVVSGGQGRNETIPEAQAMGDWLLRQGFPEERIIREGRSTSTMENLRYARELIEADSDRPIEELRVKIVSSDYHCFRAQMLARRAGFAQVSGYGADTPAMVAPSCYIREALALVKSFLLDH